MGCNLTKICNVTKNGESDGKLEWNIFLDKDYLYDSNNQYCYKVFQIDVCGEPVEVRSGEITESNFIESNNSLNIAKIVVDNLPAGHFKFDILGKEYGQIVEGDEIGLLLVLSNCSGTVREPDKLQMIISNNKQISCCKSKSDLTIVGGVAPYTVCVNNVDVSESYSRICLHNCKVNKIKVTDANGCELCRKL